jgi:hypothetical protein
MQRLVDSAPRQPGIVRELDTVEAPLLILAEKRQHRLLQRRDKQPARIRPSLASGKQFHEELRFILVNRAARSTAPGSLRSEGNWQCGLKGLGHVTRFI